MPSSTAVILIAHGSRAEGTVEAHGELAGRLAVELDARVHPAFLEISEPAIPTAIEGAVEGGARRIVLVPYFLLGGNHTRRDIPEIIERASAAHPGVEFSMTAPLGPDQRLVEICAERAREALARPAAAPR